VILGPAAEPHSCAVLINENTKIYIFRYGQLDLSEEG